MPLYGKEGSFDRMVLAKEVIDYEIDLLKNDQIYEKLVIATLVLCNKILDKNALEQYYEEIKNMLKILEIARDDGLRQGIKKGTEKGKEEGKKEGILQTARKMVIEVLEEKLGVVPGRIIDQIRSVDKDEVLSGLHRQAIRCDNFDTFEGQLRFAVS